MMKKNEILVTYGTDYVNMTEELLREGRACGADW